MHGVRSFVYSFHHDTNKSRTLIPTFFLFLFGSASDDSDTVVNDVFALPTASFSLSSGLLDRGRITGNVEFVDNVVIVAFSVGSDADSACGTVTDSMPLRSMLSIRSAADASWSISASPPAL